jgi:hypothetical protein
MSWLSAFSAEEEMQQQNNHANVVGYKTDNSITEIPTAPDVDIDLHCEEEFEEFDETVSGESELPGSNLLYGNNSHPMNSLASKPPGKENVFTSTMYLRSVLTKRNNLCIPDELWKCIQNTDAFTTAEIASYSRWIPFDPSFRKVVKSKLPGPLTPKQLSRIGLLLPGLPVTLGEKTVGSVQSIKDLYYLQIKWNNSMNNFGLLAKLDARVAFDVYRTGNLAFIIPVFIALQPLQPLGLGPWISAPLLMTI